MALAKKIKKYGFSRKGGMSFLNDHLLGCRRDVMVTVEWKGGKVELLPFTRHRNPNVLQQAYGEDDGTWHTDLKRFADTEPKRCANKKHLLRLQIWDLAFQLAGDEVTLSPE